MRHAPAFLLSALALAATGAAAPAGAAAPRYDHQVVVATTSRDFESDIDASLERQVNALGALGYELTALVGGDGPILDLLLNRRPYVAGLVDHSGLTFAVMARPEGQPAVVHEYRIVHVRTGLGMDEVVAPLGAAGFRLALSAHETDIVHVAFEKTAEPGDVTYRVFRNRGRRSWMDQALAEADTRARMTRVVPLALDTGLIELGPAQASPGDMQWLSKPAHLFESLEGPLRELAKGGYRVQLLRTRLTTLDVLVVKPAGVTSGTADYDLDDGPWGMACGRGTIAGTAVMPDGDVACITDRSTGAAVPGGLDLTLREQSTAGGQILFRGPDCDLRARLASTRTGAPRVTLALQFARELARAVPDGARVVRAHATRDSRGQLRLVTLTSDAAPDARRGVPAAAGEPPPLFPELDGLGQDLARQREEAINAALARDARLQDWPLWVELDTRGAMPDVRLLGCVPGRLDRDLAELVTRGLLGAQGLAGRRLDNRVVVDR
jgi:hypothetical protein